MTDLQLPCLVTRGAPGAPRSTWGTVEALSLQPPDSAGPHAYYGVNQGRANEYVEHFLRAGVLEGIGAGAGLQRERRARPAWPWRPRPQLSSLSSDQLAGPAAGPAPH